MNMTCFIRYQIDPFRKEAFRACAENWDRIIPRCGGDLIGYCLPDKERRERHSLRCLLEANSFAEKR